MHRYNFMNELIDALRYRYRSSYREFVLNSRVKSFRCIFFLLLVIVAAYRAAQKLKSVLRIVNGQLRLSVEHLSVGPFVPSKA